MKFFVDVFDIGLDDEARKKLIRDIESKYDICWMRVIFEQIKNAFTLKFMGYNKTKNLLRIARIKERLSSEKIPGIKNLFEDRNYEV